MTTKKAKLFATFDNPDDWLTHNVVIEDGCAKLKAEKRLIYASDMDPQPPVVEHTFNYGGEQVTRRFINPPNTSESILYTYEIAPELPIGDRRFLGDHCLYQFAALSVDKTTSTSSAYLTLFPRYSADSTGLLFVLEIGDVAPVYGIKGVYGGDWIYGGLHKRPKYREIDKISIFKVWVVGHDMFRVEAQGYQGYFNTSGGPIAKSFMGESAADVRGVFRIGPNWVTDTVYFGSPGGEENNGDPAVLQIWPIKHGWVFPKNEKELYITITEEMLEKAQTGEAEIYVPNQGRWMTSFVLSDYIADVLYFPNFSVYWVALQEDWKLDWHEFLQGGVMIFPEVEGASPLRIHNTTTGIIAITDWGIPEDLLVSNRRVELHACSVIPCATPYPIPEGGPDDAAIVPLAFNGNLMTFKGFTAGQIEPGTKYTFGFLLCNLPDPTINIEISELTLIVNPAPDTTMGYWPVNIEFEFENDDTEPTSHRVQVWSEDDEGFKKTLEWEASTEASWVELSKTSGTSDGPPDSFDITVDPTDLQPGTYSTTITIEGAGETKQVQVSATKKKKLSIVAREKPVVVRR